MKGCNFLPTLSSYCHWAVWVLKRATPTVTRASVYNGHLREPVTLTPNAERLAVELTTSFKDLQVCRGWGSNTQPSACGEIDLTHCRGFNYVIHNLICLQMQMQMQTRIIRSNFALKFEELCWYLISILILYIDAINFSSSLKHVWIFQLFCSSQQ